MTSNHPIIATTERTVTDGHGFTRVIHGWTITRGGKITETGDGFESGIQAVRHAVGVAEGRFA